MSRKNANGMSGPEFLGHMYGTDEILTYPLYDNPHNRSVISIIIVNYLICQIQTNFPFSLQSPNSITYTMVPVLKKPWAEHFVEKGKESGKKTIKVNNQNISTGSNCGLQLPQDPMEVMKCPLQRSATQGRYSTLFYTTGLFTQRCRNV